MDIFNRPPAISEDTLHYVLYPAANLSDQLSLATLATSINSFVDDNLPPNFIWHRDSFELKVVSDDEADGRCLLEGRMRIGDSVDDEWCAVWILREVTSKWDFAVRRVHLAQPASSPR
jgi:hypothetical protein